MSTLALMAVLVHQLLTHLLLNDFSLGTL